jgi:plasmid stabilization system protein ParE
MAAVDSQRRAAYRQSQRGYRKYPSGSHLHLHRCAAGGIEIVRILHNRMDCESDDFD